MGWYNASWSKRKLITVDNTKVFGASHTDFPVLISRTDADIKAAAQGDGDDILFTAADGETKLDHEIEKWDSGTGVLVAWVRVPTLSGSVDTDIYVYYGNPGATDQQNINGVWNSDYKGVWHLGESSGLAIDSTVNGYDGVFNGGLPDSVAAQIANGQDCGGSPDNISIDTLLDVMPAALAISFWFSPRVTFDSGAGASQYPAGSKSNINGSDRQRIYLNAGDGKLNFFTEQNNAGIKDLLSTNISWTGGEWYFVVCTWDTTNGKRLFIDGILDVSDGAETTLMADGTYTDLFIGSSDVGGEYFDGKVDEVRTLSAILSEDWIETEYNNQDSPGTFYTVGPEEEPAIETTMDRIGGVLERTAAGVLVRVVIP